jgi:hypothetical protein
VVESLLGRHVKENNDFEVLQIDQPRNGLVRVAEIGKEVGNLASGRRICWQRVVTRPAGREIVEEYKCSELALGRLGSRPRDAPQVFVQLFQEFRDSRVGELVGLPNLFVVKVILVVCAPEGVNSRSIAHSKK